MSGQREWPDGEEVNRRSDDDLVQIYTDAAAAADDLANSATQNFAADCVARVYRELRSRGPASQRRLLPLLGHTHPGVRAWAAAHALEFDPTAGESVLAVMAKSDATLRGFSADVTLREWRAGRLRFP